MKRTRMALLTISVMTVSCQKEFSALKNNPSDENIWAAWEARQLAPQKFTVNAHRLAKTIPAVPAASGTAGIATGANR